MQLNGKEMAAILKMGKAMAMADGRVDDNEVAVMILELQRFGVPEEDVEKLLPVADMMEVGEALSTLANLDDEKKKYVSSYLGVIMAADGDIDDKEMALWQLVSTLCGFPTMSIVDAITNMANL